MTTSQPSHPRRQPYSKTLAADTRPQHKDISTLAAFKNDVGQEEDQETTRLLIGYPLPPPHHSAPDPSSGHDSQLATIAMRIFALVFLSTLVIGSILAFAAVPQHRTSGGVGAVHTFKPYTAPSAFPTTAFPNGYYQPPGDFTAEPRPIVTNILDNSPFPDSLDDPHQLPTGAPASEAVFPRPSSSPTPGMKDEALRKIQNIIEDTTSGDSNCTRCIQALEVGQKLVRSQPRSGPEVMVSLCKRYSFLGTQSGLSQDEICERQFAPSTLGAQYTSILSYANLSDVDGEAICSTVSTYCTAPPPSTLTDAFIKKWFKGHHKAPRHISKKTGDPLKGQRKDQMLKVAHLSDVHIDSRYLVGAEASCTSGQCCRADSFNNTVVDTFKAGLNESTLVKPAGYWGEYSCDPPWSVVMSAFEAVTPLNDGKDVDMTLFTGDLTTHDATYHISRQLVNQAEQVLHDQMKRALGNGPLFIALGNHDSSPSDAVSQNDLPKGHDTFDWNWDYVKKLWASEGWMTHDAAEEIGKHYGGYSVSPRKGLRVISLNTNLWYKGNAWNLINYGKFDPSGVLRFLTDELQRAEDGHEAVWIVGHVYTGWSGSDPLRNPTNLLQLIVERYHQTIRHLFFGHSHEDFFNVFYRDNASSTLAQNAIAHSFVGPSITPGHNVNPGVRIYEVDPETYEVDDYHQFYTQLSTFDSLLGEGHGPVWRHLYSAREAYGLFSASVEHGQYSLPIALTSTHRWPAGESLTPAFWAQVTTEMLLRPSLMDDFTTYQGRNSSRSPGCASQECREAKVCYLRSATAPLGRLCPRGFSSVQGG